MADTVLTLRALNRATLARQLLLERSPLPVPQAVEQVFGLQAQLSRAAFAGLWTRLQGFARESLAGALHARELVRATTLRGTLHLHSARDFLALRASLQLMLTQGMQSVLRERARGLDLARLGALARTLLAAPLSFEQLRPLLAEGLGATDERALGYAVRTQLPLVQVPDEGPWCYPASPAFALAETWLGAPLSADARPHALLRRYLAAFGPASALDAQRYTGLRGLAPVLEALRPELRVFRDERGRELFDLESAPRPDGDAAAPVRLLPEFDSLVLAHDDRSRVVADEHRGALIEPGLRVPPSFLVDGFVSGLWRLERSKGRATLRLEPFGKLARTTVKALTEEAEKMLLFLEPEAKQHEVVLAR